MANHPVPLSRDGLGLATELTAIKPTIPDQPTD